jgi:hypothetical protein
MYLMVVSRPDLCYAVGRLGQFTHAPTERHWTDLKRTLRFVSGTRKDKLILGGHDFVVEAYVDADYASDPLTRRSVTGYLFKIGDAGPCIWRSVRQKTVALSTTEAEYMALAECVQEGMWVAGFLKELGMDIGPMTLHEDNMSTLHLAQGNKTHGRTKHIDVKYHFVRQALAEKKITLAHCGTRDMLADILTKPLGRDLFRDLKTRLWILGPPSGSVGGVAGSDPRTVEPLASTPPGKSEGNN